MKNLRSAIVGALAVVAILFIAFGVMLRGKVRGQPFPFPGPGHSDFSVHLAGDYYVHRTSGLHIMIAPEGHNEETPVIPSLVIECATDGRFIIAKRHGVQRRSPNDPNDTFEVENPSLEDFWILDSSEPHVDGPLTESELISRRRSLGISESIVLRNVYDFNKR